MSENDARNYSRLSLKEPKPGSCPRVTRDTHEPSLDEHQLPFKGTIRTRHVADGRVSAICTLLRRMQVYP